MVISSGFSPDPYLTAPQNNAPDTVKTKKFKILSDQEKSFLLEKRNIYELLQSKSKSPENEVKILETYLVELRSCYQWHKDDRLRCKLTINNMQKKLDSQETQLKEQESQLQENERQLKEKEALFQENETRLREKGILLEESEKKNRELKRKLEEAFSELQSNTDHSKKKWNDQRVIQRQTQTIADLKDSLASFRKKLKIRCDEIRDKDRELKLQYDKIKRKAQEEQRFFQEECTMEKCLEEREKRIAILEENRKQLYKKFDAKESENKELHTKLESLRLENEMLTSRNQILVDSIDLNATPCKELV